MDTKLIDIKQDGIPAVESGQAKNAADFFNQVIKKQFENKEVIKATHEALMEYVNSSDAVFVLRMFGSDPAKNYENLRRGFLTIYPSGKKMVFCDNTFAMPFAAMKLAGKAYSNDELREYMENPSTKVGFGMTTEEKEISYYNWTKNKATINLNSAGWYLAHIVPVGRKFLGKNIGSIFTRPPRSEWEKAENHIRRPNTDMTEGELAVLKAHFLRMVHPLNSFLVPKRSLLAYNGNNIGEEKELIGIVREYIKKEFPKEYEELAENILIPEDEQVDHAIGQIIWANSESGIKNARKKFNIKAEARKIQKEEQDDIFNKDEEEMLQRKLYSVGKSVFLKLYPVLKKNPDATLEDIDALLPDFKTYSLEAKKTRLSNTRSILRQGLEVEALTNILASSRLSSSDLKKASNFLKELGEI